MYLTRNQAWVQIHRGFESHPLRQYSKRKPSNFNPLLVFLLLKFSLALETDKELHIDRIGHFAQQKGYIHVVMNAF